MKKTAVLILVLLLQTISFSTIRFVSKTGSSIEPYTSWATAADSIQKCIDFSQSGDTIYIGPGTYVETLIVAEGIALIGSGIDSTIIDSRPIAYLYMNTVLLANNNILKNLQIRTDRNDNGFCIYTGLDNEFSQIEYCYLRDAFEGVQLFNTNTVCKNNIVENCYNGFFYSGFLENYPVITENTIYVNVNGGQAIHHFASGHPTINNNTIIMTGINADGMYTIMYAVEVKNNLVVHESTGRLGIYMSGGNEEVSNNVVVGNFYRRSMKFLHGRHKIRNNVVLNGNIGIEMEEQFTIDYKYNNVWNTAQPYIGFTPDSTNLSVEPMFVSEDSLDFHLQKYSPLIDAGDPNIFDVDGSRSDIGLYGGPNGEVYFYEDLAPKPPVNLNGEIDSNVVSITWNKNHEADFSHYNIYRSKTSGFAIGAHNLIAETGNNYFNELITNDKNIYYKITSLDREGHESQPSEELAIVVVGVGTAEVKVKDYLLYQNFPNPFNPTTTIGYRIKESGFVRLTVYDVKGEKVAQLENGYKSAGYHEVKFTGRKIEGETLSEQISSGLYIYRLEVRNENNVTVFIDSGKMMMVK